MRDEEGRDTTPTPAPSYVRRVLADLPTREAVRAEAEAVPGGEEARLTYLACRFEGLYWQCYGLLEAAENEPPRRTTWVESLGIAGLRPVYPAELAEYDKAMAEAIPEIVQAVQKRDRLAAEARQRTLGEFYQRPQDVST